MIVMNIHLKIFATKLRSAAFAVVTLSVLLVGSIGSASAMGVNGLIGVFPGFPQIDGTGVLDQGVSYIPTGGGQGLLSATSTPNFYFPDAGSIEFIQNGELELEAFIDSSGTTLAVAIAS